MTRADDELTLAILRLHKEGAGPSEIARRLCLKREAVRSRMVRIQTADIAHDPEAAPFWREHHRRT